MIEYKTVIFDKPDSFEKLELVCGARWTGEFSLKIDGQVYERIKEFHFDCVAGERSRFVIVYRNPSEMN